MLKVLDKFLENKIKSLNFFSLLLLRLGLGIAFIIHGKSKFPLPPKNLIDFFGFSPFLASFVAVSEVLAGFTLILGIFIKFPRVAGSLASAHLLPFPTENSLAPRQPSAAPYPPRPLQGPRWEQTSNLCQDSAILHRGSACNLDTCSRPGPAWPGNTGFQNMRPPSSKVPNCI